MIQRALVGSALAALALVWTVPSSADPVNFSLTISYDQAADTFLPAGVMTGTVQFYTAAEGTDTFSAFGGPINIGSLSITHSFADNFAPTDPCLGLTVCQIGFSFTGKAQATDLTTGFPAFAFLNVGDAPNAVPPTPIFPVVDNFTPGDPASPARYAWLPARSWLTTVRFRSVPGRLRLALLPSPAPSWALACPA